MTTRLFQQSLRSAACNGMIVVELPWSVERLAGRNLKRSRVYTWKRLNK